MFIALAVAPGELLDRLTILELRSARAASEGRRRSAGAALARARAPWAAAALDEAPLDELIGALRSVNQSLWQAEDEIRRHERRGNFGAGFVAAARAIPVSTIGARVSRARSTNAAAAPTHPTKRFMRIESDEWGDQTPAPASVARLSEQLATELFVTKTGHDAVFAQCPMSDEDTPTLLLRGSVDGQDTHWAMQTRPGSVAVPLGLLTVPHVQSVGNLVFYAEGQLGSRPLMVADVSTGARRAATAPLLSIDDFQAEPASDSIIIKTAAGLLAYRISAAKLDACDGD